MPKKTRMRERREGGRQGGWENDSKEGPFSQELGRKTTKLLKRTPMTKATAMMSKNLGTCQVRPSPGVQGCVHQIYPVCVWPMQRLLSFLTIGVRG